MKPKSIYIFSLFIFFVSCNKDTTINPTVQIPVLTTSDIINITQNAASSGGTITDDGGSAVISRGVCWSIGSTPTINDSKTLDGAGGGSFTSSVKGLIPNTDYFIRAYATNSSGTGYGMSLSFKTSAIQLPSIMTTPVTNVTLNSAICGGNISSDGGSPVTARGICWNTIGTPTISDSKTTDSTGIGSFTSSLTNLSMGTTYYIRAYATNSAGTNYGYTISFKTLALLPTLSTITITNITQTTALGGGNISSDGGASVTIRGVCWSTSQNPTTSNNKTSDGSGMGIFYSNLINLSSGTTYYVRAYAINDAGTAYGNQTSFTTLALPTLSTVTITNITQTTATSGGNISSDGGAIITSRGVCWSTSQNPTTSNNKTLDGSGMGSFTSNLTNLSLGTTYYVRAYAINNAGTAYGNQILFTTSTLPKLSTISVTNITSTDANSGGVITSDGGANITARGVCWSTNTTPSINNYKTSDGIGTGDFSSAITGLTGYTTYYLRAYATNSVGTSYGNVISFLTKPAYGGTVTDIDGNVYHTVKIGTQVWMVENLKTMKYRNGEAISPAWTNLTTGAYCNYTNDANNATTYGRLYNWYAVSDNRNIAPTGWHVPTDAEWTVLTDYLGGPAVAGGKLKEIGTTHWNYPNTEATNETGFTALPGGYRNNYGTFNGIGIVGCWWSSAEGESDSAWYREFGSSLLRLMVEKHNGFSVRCIKD